jgi:hypothetical protein
MRIGWDKRDKRERTTHHQSHQAGSRGLYSQPTDMEMPLSADVKAQVNLLYY